MIQRLTPSEIPVRQWKREASETAVGQIYYRLAYDTPTLKPEYEYMKRFP